MRAAISNEKYLLDDAFILLFKIKEPVIPKNSDPKNNHKTKTKKPLYIPTIDKQYIFTKSK